MIILTPPKTTRTVAVHFEADHTWTMAYHKAGRWHCGATNQILKGPFAGWSEVNDARKARMWRMAIVELAADQEVGRAAA